MNKLWQFLNSPLIVAFLTIVVVVTLITFGAAKIFSRFDTNQAQRDKIEALGRQEIISFSEVNVSTNHPQRFVGEIRNHSKFIVHNITGTICFFGIDGRLIDVISRQLSGIGSITPGESRKFFLERDDYSDSFSPSAFGKVKGRSIITLVDLETTESTQKPEQLKAFPSEKSDAIDPFSVTGAPNQSSATPKSAPQ